MDNYLVIVKSNDSILYTKRITNKEILLEKFKCRKVEFIYEDEYRDWLERYI